MTGLAEFTVFQFFPEGDHEEVVTQVDAPTAVARAKALTESVGGRMGTTARVIITDGADYTVFEWLHGQGVVFPPEAASAEAAG
jgi:hypothetical protein